MKRIKSIISLFIVLLLAVSCMGFSVSAAACKTTISCSSQKATVGETVTITVKFSGQDTQIESAQGTVGYNTAVLSYQGGNNDASENASGKISLIKSSGATSSISFPLVFKVKAEGSCLVSVSDALYVAAGGNSELEAQGSSFTFKFFAATPSTPSTPALSGNANLKSLSVGGATLSPAFSSSRTGYTATVANSVSSVKVTARAADSGAKVEGTGTYTLEVGNNKVSVTVTAANGSKKTYSISVKRQTPEETAAQQAELNKPDPLDVVVEGKNYRIAADISKLTVPTGFAAAKTKYKETEVGVFNEESGRYTLYYLTETATQKSRFFTLGEDGEFKSLAYLQLGGKMYIFERPEAGLIAPDSYYETTLSLDTGNAKAYAYKDADMADIYVVYCWSEGETRFYRYDKMEGTIQRAPDFSLLEEAIAEPDTPKNGILDRFKGISNTGKIIILLVALSVMCAVALIVLLAIKLFGSKAAMPKQVSEENELFETVEVEGFSVDEKETE